MRINQELTKRATTRNCQRKRGGGKSDQKQRFPVTEGDPDPKKQGGKEAKRKVCEKECQQGKK